MQQREKERESRDKESVAGFWLALTRSPRQVPVSLFKVRRWPRSESTRFQPGVPRVFPCYFSPPGYIVPDDHPNRAHGHRDHRAFLPSTFPKPASRHFLNRFVLARKEGFDDLNFSMIWERCEEKRNDGSVDEVYVRLADKRLFYIAWRNMSQSFIFVQKGRRISVRFDAIFWWFEKETMDWLTKVRIFRVGRLFCSKNRRMR